MKAIVKQSVCLITYVGLELIKLYPLYNSCAGQYPWSQRMCFWHCFWSWVAI
jgi:hypothetical protein